MVVGAVGIKNYANSYRDSLKKRQQTGVMLLGSGGLATIAGLSPDIKNNWVGLSVLTVGVLSGLIGMIDFHKAGKELKELEKQQKLNTEI